MAKSLLETKTTDEYIYEAKIKLTIIKQHSKWFSIEYIADIN